MQSKTITLVLLSSFIYPICAVSLPGFSPSRFFNGGSCADSAKPGVLPSTAFCSNPPTASVNLDVYKGTWFQTYGSGAALQFSGDSCTTANYKLNKNGTVAVLNCSVRDGKTTPTCVRAIASQRPDTTDSGKLQVFFPSAPPSPGNPGRYNVAALLGNEKTGYLAAAVYTCLEIPGRPSSDGFFIISRTTLLKSTLLHLLKKKLECKGYDTSQTFKVIPQTGCKYFFQDSGFELE